METGIEPKVFRHKEKNGEHAAFPFSSCFFRRDMIG